ncbi:hypothetical protein L2E82_17379 [Cichorium intybus]|uniref:Uncharacterized protein n=1 Tax=Cichorium intybus TaxID=13427 RepID=A0ACB9F8L5_CICIN|nr:hypothetical protein L2E82_17379 [Cichorium intybus]
MKSKELLKSSIVVKKHEFHVKNLEEDLENQARGIEADMEDLVGVKVDQEQKVIRVEENLIKDAWLLMSSKFPRGQCVLPAILLVEFSTNANAVAPCPKTLMAHKKITAT